MLNNIEILLFERLCKAKSELNLLTSSNFHISGMHTVSVDSINDYYVEKLIHTINNYNLKQ